MSSKTKLVSLVRGKGRHNNIIEALSLIKEDLWQIKNKKNILIKPNLTATKNKYANTAVEAVRAIIEFLLKNYPELKNAQITVADGSGSAFYSGEDTKDVLKRFGYYKLEKEYKNVKIESLDHYDKFFEVPIKTVVGNSKIRVSERIHDFDYIISLAIPKTHNYGIATFGIKNMMGFVKKEDRILMHGLKTDIDSDIKTLFDHIPPSLISKARRNLPNKVMNILFGVYPKFKKSVKIVHHNLVTMAKNIYPDLVVIDGYYGMEGDGPIDGSPVKMDLCVASADPLKADSTAARCMGFKPEEIGYIYYLKQEGLGDISLKGLVGSDLKKNLFKFKPHGTHPIQKKWRE